MVAGRTAEAITLYEQNLADQERVLWRVRRNLYPHPGSGSAGCPGRPSESGPVPPVCETAVIGKVTASAG